MYSPATNHTFQRFIIRLYPHKIQTVQEEIKAQLHESKLLMRDDSNQKL
jgi:hypothetical protein